MKRRIRLSLAVLVLVPLLTLSVSCDCYPRRIVDVLFVATFNSDTICSPPAPTPQDPYGPPGASLNWEGPEGTVHVIDSAALGSRALKITRGDMWEPATVEAVLGNIDGVPNDAGIYNIYFNAHGEVIPDYHGASMGIYVKSIEERLAFALSLYDGCYQVWEGSDYHRLDGAYDPGMAHTIRIKLNLDTRQFSFRVNNEVLVSNEAFLHDDFANFHSLMFIGPWTVTEAIPMEFVVDEIRIIK